MKPVAIVVLTLIVKVCAQTKVQLLCDSSDVCLKFFKKLPELINVVMQFKDTILLVPRLAKDNGTERKDIDILCAYQHLSNKNQHHRVLHLLQRCGLDGKPGSDMTVEDCAKFLGVDMKKMKECQEKPEGKKMVDDSRFEKCRLKAAANKLTIVVNDNTLTIDQLMKV